MHMDLGSGFAGFPPCIHREVFSLSSLPGLFPPMQGRVELERFARPPPLMIERGVVACLYYKVTMVVVVLLRC